MKNIRMEIMQHIDSRLLLQLGYDSIELSSQKRYRLVTHLQFYVGRIIRTEIEHKIRGVMEPNFNPGGLMFEIH